MAQPDPSTIGTDITTLSRKLGDDHLHQLHENILRVRENLHRRTVTHEVMEPALSAKNCQICKSLVSTLR